LKHTYRRLIAFKINISYIESSGSEKAPGRTVDSALSHSLADPNLRLPINSR